MHVLFVAMSTSRLQQTVRDIRFLLDHGGRATVITTKAANWSSLDPAASLHELATAESRHWFVRSERIAVFRGPDLLLRVVRKLLALAVRVLPVPGGDRLLAKFDGLRRRQATAAKTFHKQRFGPFYRNVRPYVLWRTARSQLLPRIDLDDVDAVVIADALSTPIGWHLAQEHGELPVTFSLDRDRVLATQPAGEAG